MRTGRGRSRAERDDARGPAKGEEREEEKRWERRRGRRGTRGIRGRETRRGGGGGHDAEESGHSIRSPAESGMPAGRLRAKKGRRRSAPGDAGAVAVPRARWWCHGRSRPQAGEKRRGERMAREDAMGREGELREGVRPHKRAGRGRRRTRRSGRRSSPSWPVAPKAMVNVEAARAGAETDKSGRGRRGWGGGRETTVARWSGTRRRGGRGRGRGRGRATAAQKNAGGAGIARA